MLDTKKLKSYIIYSIIVLIFSEIYQLFSHNVYSIYMSYAFLIPLIAGLLYMLFNKYINKYIYDASIATFTIGSIVSGVLIIYGTSNKLVYIYLIVGLVSLFVSILKK